LALVVSDVIVNKEQILSMRFYLSVIFLLIVVQSAFSQAANDEELNRAIGIDINFINNFLPLDNPIGFKGDYLIHYIQFKENSKFYRHAFDLDLSGSFENNESEVDRDDINVDVNYKISRGKKRTFLEKGYVLYGPEMSIGYFLNRVANLDPNDPDGMSFNTNTDQVFSIAAGPFVGIGYNITKRISLYTEASAALRLSYSIDNFVSDSTPLSDFKDTRFAVRTRYVLPRSIILFYHF